MQILLFSATFNDNVKMFISKMIPNANHVFVKEEDFSLDAIKQYCVKCPSKLAKIKVLKDRVFPLAEKLGQTIIFVRTRESASKLHSMLEAEGYRCTSMQGHLKLEDRDRIIGEFRSGITRIFAQGFDQAQVTFVVNFELPVRVYSIDELDYEVYLHTIGRSGRFGRKGVAFNCLVTTQDEENMTKIEIHFQ